MTILDWIHDEFVKPITDMINGIVASFANKAGEAKAEDITNKVKEISSSISEIQGREIEAHSPLTLEEAFTEVDKNAADVINQWRLLYGEGIVASVLSLGTAQFAISQAFGAPENRNAFDFVYTLKNMRTIASELNFTQRYYNALYTSVIPEAYRVALAYSHNRIGAEDFYKFMAENGLNSFWADIYANMNLQEPDAGTLLALWRRGEIDDKVTDLSLRFGGFHPDMATRIMKLKDVIPPLPDLINMAVKEAFGEHVSDDQYPELVEWGKKMGLSEYFTGAYWYAHWERIPLAQMYDNLYRDFWDKDKFLHMLKIKDLHPDDREALFNVAYQVPSIRELGYGYDVGLYDRDAIVKWRRYAGLSPADAEKAADSLILYRNEAEKNAVLTEHMYLYGYGKITKDEFIANIKGKGIPQTTIDLWVERADAYKIRISKPTPLEEGRIISSSEAIWAYKNLNETADWLRVQLKAVDWADDRIELEILRADKEIADAIPKPADIPTGTLTQSQMESLYKAGILPTDQMYNLFRARNFPDGYTSWLVKLWDIDIAQKTEPKSLTRSDLASMYDLRILNADEIKAHLIGLGYADRQAEWLSLQIVISSIFPDLKAMYSKGWITEGQMYDALVATGLSGSRAGELMMTVVKYVQPTRVAAEKDLTKAEIIKGWKSGVLDDTQAVELLMDLGYSEDEAYYLLQINMIVAKADPESYWEMKKVTEAYKKALGQKSKPVPDDLLVWEARYKQVKKELDDLRAKGASDVELSAKVIQVADVEAEYKRAMVEWERLAT